MAVSTCWMVIDYKDMPLGIGFTKKHARFSARDYLLNVSSTHLTPNQAMNELKRRLHHKYLFFRKYELCEIEFGPDGRSSYHPNNRSLKSEVMKLRKENLLLKQEKGALYSEVEKLRKVTA